MHKNYKKDLPIVKIKPTQNKIENLWNLAIATDLFFVNKSTFIN